MFHPFRVFRSFRSEEASLACRIRPAANGQESDWSRYKGHGVLVSVALFLFTLMLSLGSSGPQQSDLRISIARIETADSKPSNPEFAITLVNRWNEDFVVDLGYMLGNGKRMFPDAITLLFTDPSGRTSKLHYRPPVRVGGRIDDYTVALRRHASYVFRMSLAQYRSPYSGEGRSTPPVDGELDPKLPFGTWSVQATFDGLPARYANSDTQGIRLMNFWTGAVSSNVLRFVIPH